MLIRKESEIIVPGLQEILTFAPPSDSPALEKVLLEEIRRGALKIGVFGSRTRKNPPPNSDLDIAVLNRKAGKTLLYAERYGDYRHCHNSEVTTIFCRWVDVQRFNPSEEPVDMNDPIKRSILKTTLWLWERPIR